MSIRRFCKASAMVAFAASVSALTAPSASAQSFMGDTFSYQVLGQSVMNTTGTATVGNGPEFTFIAVDAQGEAIAYTVDINGSSIIISAGVGTPGATMQP